jgi:hypothetical protein
MTKHIGKRPKSMAKRSSAPQNTATGSGSRPMSGKFPIAATAPKNPRSLDGRKTRSALS